MILVPLIVKGKSGREEGFGESIISSILDVLNLRYLGDIQFKMFNRQWEI